MPKLPTFDAPLGGLPGIGGRRATSEDFGGGVAQAIGQIGGALRQVNNDIEESESRDALVQSTEIRAKYAKRLDEAAVSGADTQALQEEMNDELSKVGENFATRKGRDSLQFYSANTNLMFDEQANNIAVTRAGAEAKLAAGKFLTSTGALLGSNPLYLKTAEADADALVSTFTRISPEKKAEIAANLKNELNVSAAVASARLDPHGTKIALMAGDWDLTPAQREQVTKQAEQEIRGMRADIEYERTQREREKAEINMTARGETLKQIMDGSASAKAILADSRMDPITQEHMIGLLEQRSKEGPEAKSNPTTKRDLFLRVTAPDGDPSKIYNDTPIYEAAKAGQLNVTDANWLNNLVAAQKDEKGRSLATRLNGRMSVVSAAMRADPVLAAMPELSAAVQLQMISEVEEAEARMRQEGKDPNALLDPDSKDYYFTPNRLKLVKEDVQAQMRGDQLGTATAPEIGTIKVIDGQRWEFLGGDPSKRESWVQVDGGRSASGVIR